MGTYVTNKTNQSLDVWQSVKIDIENKILSGYYMAGTRMPSVRRITEEYNIGQATAQRVLSMLSQEGIIESKRGVGYFVNPYIKERLITKRKWELEKKIKECVEDAEIIGVDILPMIKRLVEKG